MNRVRILIVAIVALAAGLFMTPSAQAAPSDNPYQPGACATLSISATTARIGDTLHISGVGFTPGDELDIVVHSDPVVIKHISVDATGIFGFDWVVPDLSEGSHVITVEGSSNATCPIDPLEIVISGTNPTEPGGNANTGVDSLTMILIAIALLGAGLLIATAGRRRHHHGRHSHSS